jgi:hypothetical protein
MIPLTASRSGTIADTMLTWAVVCGLTSGTLIVMLTLVGGH